jgi:uncharacterized protein (DUF362 family)
LSLVSFVRVINHDYNSVKRGIKESLDLINFNFSRNVNKIVIKPNICYYYHPSTGEVTDPWFVSVLIDVLRDNFGECSDIYVVESDASAMKCKYAFKMLGYDRMARGKNVKLINLTETRSRIVDITVNNAKFEFHVPELFYEADLVVNVPKIKYMSYVKITCALKNMFGCNAFPRKYIYHKALDEAIVGINKLIRTNLVVVDGLIVSGRYTKRLGLIMSSEDLVAVDTAAAKLMGLNPRSVRHITLAFKEGLGKMNYLPMGEFSYFKEIFPKKNLKENLRNLIAAVYLKVFQAE